MARTLLVLAGVLITLVGCASAPTSPTAPPIPTAIVTLSGAIAHPTAPIRRVQATATPAGATPAGATPAGATPADVSAAPVLTPTATPADTIPGVLPTVTPTPAGTLPVTATVAAQPDTGSALPATYRARVVFGSVTTFAGGEVQEQSGEFTLTRVQAANAYGSNEAYELTTLDPDGQRETMAVYQVDDHVAVRFASEEWAVMDRATGSSVAVAIQPIGYLAQRFVQMQDQAADLGKEDVNGLATRHLRLDDLALAADLFAQSGFQMSGAVVAFQFDAWLLDPGSTVVRYTLEMETSGSQVLDAQLQPVTADQAVAWTFEVLNMDGDVTVEWPEDAPAPGVLEVPGFAPGEFPLPPGARILSHYAGFQELSSPRPVAEVAAFYRQELEALGWQVEGEFGLWACTKDGLTFQLMIVEDEENGDSRITILSGG